MGLEYLGGLRDEGPDCFSAGGRHDLYVNRHLKSAKTLYFGFLQAEYQPQPDKSPGQMLRLLRTSAPTCIHVRVYGRREERLLCSPSFFHPLSPFPILVQERRKAANSHVIKIASHPPDILPCTTEMCWLARRSH